PGCLLRWKRDENPRVQPALLESMGTWVQAVEPSPCRPGLAWRFAGWFGVSHAVRACSFPLGLSSSGEPVDPGVLAGLLLSSEMRIERAVTRRRRPKQPRSTFAARCLPLRLSPSTREPVRSDQWLKGIPAPGPERDQTGPRRPVARPAGE